MKPLIYVADSHLMRNDVEVDSFIEFLEKAGSQAQTLCILGDLFNVWFGEPKFRMPHQERVLVALRALASSGVTLKFVEGNRDFCIRRNYLGAPFADVAEGVLIEEYAGRRILSTHGDEVNRKDRQYRLWKRVSKSIAVYGVFRLLPASWGIRLGEILERKLSGTNIRHKAVFPMEECRAYAEAIIRDGCEAIVLGHFHEEREIKLAGGILYVLPSWRDGHRYLEFRGREPGRFVTFGP
jgi:UDP-2,3-diacylglucosamine hydrolase